MEYVDKRARRTDDERVKINFKGTAVKTIGKDAFKGVKKNASFVMKKTFAFKNVK